MRAWAASPREMAMALGARSCVPPTSPGSLQFVFLSVQPKYWRVRLWSSSTTEQGADPRTELFEVSFSRRCRWRVRCRWYGREPCSGAPYFRDTSVGLGFDVVVGEPVVSDSLPCSLSVWCPLMSVLVRAALEASFGDGSLARLREGSW